MKMHELVAALASLCSAGLASPNTKIEAVVAVGEALRVRVAQGETFTLRITGKTDSTKCQGCGRPLHAAEEQFCSKCAPVLG